MTLIDRQKKIKQLHSLFSLLKIMHMKYDILGSYNVTSSKDLTDDQLDQLINQLNKQAQASQIKPAKEVDPEVRKWRAVNLDLLSRLGVYKDSSSWANVNRYLLNPRIAGKELYMLKIPELKALSEKLRLIIKKREKAIEDENRQAFFN